MSRLALILDKPCRIVASWFKTAPGASSGDSQDRIDWLRAIPFLLVHLACLGVIWVGWSPVAVGAALALYLLRMFAVTAFYHRYFAHRAFKTWRCCQFLFGLLGCCAGQRGPLWWAAHHRWHHRHSDAEEDLHSPRRQGFWWSHFGWFLTPGALPTRSRLIPDLLKFPELRWLERLEMWAPILLGAALYGLGAALGTWKPSLGTNGWQMLVWGFFISTVAVYHATYLVNSLAHRLGHRPYPTRDDSRNNFWLALLTLGEGWHNNHHYYPASARQGFRWWEVDLTYYVLVVMSWLGLVWDLKPVPHRVLQRREIGT